MRRKYAQLALPTLYFRDGILSVPGYTFEKVSTAVLPRVPRAELLILRCMSVYSVHANQAVPWEDTGSMTLLSEGTNLQDGTSVLAKIVPAHSNASMLLEREAHM